MIHQFPGGNALSDFRIKKILSSIQSLCPDITDLWSAYVHFALVEDSLDEHEVELFERLLDYGPAAIQRDSDLRLLVIPRPGTISPWSSKATDIFHNCGITKLQRIERGACWHYSFKPGFRPAGTTIHALKSAIHDRMTQVVMEQDTDVRLLFEKHDPGSLNTVEVLALGKAALDEANVVMGLALSSGEIDYLFDAFSRLQRNPTDVELMMFAQVNSEHCRHKIFNADWTIDGTALNQSLFDMIRATHGENPGRVLSAYRDNSAVMRGYSASRFFPDAADNCYRYHPEDVHIVFKVETHNHPTAISPRPGAATGSGGEIRDEAATGTGAKPKAGITGFAVSNLLLPGLPQPWEQHSGRPERIVSALEIMLEGPIGAASFNNEFGRPALAGYFRTFEQADPAGNIIRGYHKPIMLAGGYGMIREPHIQKRAIAADASLIVLGGPAMLIGLGGGAASSMASGESSADLDFASVQRDNPEMQRRCQEVIDGCWAMGQDNPIISIHDVGAGGLSNALPELVNESGRGACLKLREIPNDDPGMSPKEIWCNESQERYVLAVAAEKLKIFREICTRERAPFAVIGMAGDRHHLEVYDSLFENKPIDMPLGVLLGKPPGMHREITSATETRAHFSHEGIVLEDAIRRILQLPAVADKRFLITIGDRSVSGLVVRDQMVGPWQTPVADCSVTAGCYDAWVGEAVAVGERSPVALLDGPASGRLAVAEAITNIAAASITRIEDIALSANWMAACGQAGEDRRLYDTVKAVSELARILKIAIPVGKDSLSMNTLWREDDQDKQVIAPVSLNITAFAAVSDIRRTLDPQLHRADGGTCLLLIDLGAGQNRLGGSALAQVYNRGGGPPADLDSPELLSGFFRAIQLLNTMEMIQAYHDRSDGGLFITICEMAFAGRTGVDIHLDEKDDLIPVLFSEAPGAVIEIETKHRDSVIRTLADAGLDANHIREIGHANPDALIRIIQGQELIYSEDILKLHSLWSVTSYHMQKLRDNPECATEEFEGLQNRSDPGLSAHLSFAMEDTPISTATGGNRPLIAILREQGVNGHVEMAAAFQRAGFDCIDVHMSDLLSGKHSLSSFNGMVACGGFSYGDVLGGGGGWAKSILLNALLRDEFRTFFARKDSFGLGVCNGCQMMAQLHELIPGAGHWPYFSRNKSEQFESRLVMVEILDNPSILLRGMAGSRIPVSVAHGEGRVNFRNHENESRVVSAIRFIDNGGEVTQRYPANPNGSAAGLTGFTSEDGRFTIMMPHPERGFLSKQYSWLPADWTHEEGPWMKIFHNARNWIG